MPVPAKSKNGIASEMSSTTVTPTPPVQACNDCGLQFPLTRTVCPHCARPALFPNVRLAQQKSETRKLNQRYNDAIADAANRGCDSVVNQFDDDCKSSSAVCRYGVARLHRQFASGTELFAGYYDLERLRLRVDTPSGFDWEKLRPQAEVEMLGNSLHIDQIHYACLSLDGEGMSTYGDCILQLSEPMIAHRSSCFDGNTAVIYAVEHSFESRLRSDWADRHKICTATVAWQLDSTTSAADFPGILAAPDPGGDTANDSFIEVHVFGDLTSSSFQLVTFVTTKYGKEEQVYQKAVEAKLASAGVSFTSR